MLGATLTLLLGAAGLIYYFLISNYNYWRNRGVIGPKPTPLCGNLPSLFTQKRHMIYDIDDIYRAFKDKSNFVGMYNGRAPQLLILSPELIRSVLVTNFKHFHDNEISIMVDEKSDYIFGNNPFSLRGEKWKHKRGEMLPGLTQNRVKANFPVTTKNCTKLIEYIKEQLKKGSKDGFDAKDTCLRYTLEVTTDSVLGLNADSFSEKPSTPILANVKALFTQSTAFIIYFILVSLFPMLRNVYKVRFIGKPTELFFSDLMEKAVKIRKSQPQDRTDFLNFLLQLQAKKNVSDRELVVHTMTFFLDGFETTATVISHCLLLLARNPEVQQKLRDEIQSRFGRDGALDCDEMLKLPYLDACLHEAIRIFPPGIFSTKICTEPIDLVNKDGSVLHVQKDDVISLPMYSVMTDEQFYPEPQQFKPERFLSDTDDDMLKGFRDRGLYHGFSDGPRVCMGMRFALVQTKAAIVEIVRNFNVQVNAKTRSDNLFDKTYFLSTLDGGIWLDFKPL